MPQHEPSPLIFPTSSTLSQTPLYKFISLFSSMIKKLVGCHQLQSAVHSDLYTCANIKCELVYMFSDATTDIFGFVQRCREKRDKKTVMGNETRLMHDEAVCFLDFQRRQYMKSLKGRLSHLVFFSWRLQLLQKSLRHCQQNFFEIVFQAM